MPELSVVVAVYNVQNYLAKCLDSILGQTFRDFECICVNDGSTDSSLSILKKYAAKDARIQIIDKPNGGLSDARNAGMAVAQGTYIQFVDSDDFLEPECFGACVAQLKKTNADMVIFDVYQYFSATNTKEIIRNPFSDDETYSLRSTPELLVKILNAAWNKMYRLSLFQENGIQYPWGYYYEDLGTTYRLLLRCKKVAFINKPYYNYLQDRPGNITHQFNSSVYHVLDMVKITLDDYKTNGVYETYYEELKFLGCVNILECLKKTRNVEYSPTVSKFIDVCFWFIRNTWPEFPKCTYKILREKNDWVYSNPTRLKFYLKHRRKKGEEA